jgi:hypothetical protein
MNYYLLGKKQEARGKRQEGAGERNILLQLTTDN